METELDYHTYVWVRRQDIDGAMDILSSIVYDSHDEIPKWLKRMSEESIADFSIALEMDKSQRNAIAAIRSEETRKLEEYQRMLKKIKLENNEAMLEI